MLPCVHYVGFRDDRFLTARKIFGGPAFVHRWWDKRAAREIALGDVVIFAEGDWTQAPRKWNAPDSDEPQEQEGSRTVAKKRKHREAELTFGPETDKRVEEIAKAVLAKRSKLVKSKVRKKRI